MRVDGTEKLVQPVLSRSSEAGVGLGLRAPSNPRGTMGCDTGAEQDLRKSESWGRDPAREIALSLLWGNPAGIVQRSLAHCGSTAISNVLLRSALCALSSRIPTPAAPSNRDVIAASQAGRQSILEPGAYRGRRLFTDAQDRPAILSRGRCAVSEASTRTFPYRSKGVCH